MTGPDEEVAYFAPLDKTECDSLLALGRVGRVAWNSAQGLVVLPVNYRLVENKIVFHTAPGSQLAELLEPRPVAFQLDEIDAEAAVGWTVLVRGTSAPGPELESQSWVQRENYVVLQVQLEWVGGRVVSGNSE